MGGLTVKKTIILLIPLFLLWVGGCATTDDLKKTQRDYESKISSQRTDVEKLQARLDALEKNYGDTTKDLRKNQADLGADFGNVRDSVQTMRGQVEEMNKEFRSGQGAEPQEPPGRHGIPDRLHRKLPRHREEGNPQWRKGRGAGRGRRGDGGAEERCGGGLQCLLQDSSRKASTSRPGRSS